MIMRIYSIRDSKSGLFSQPWFTLNEAMARRSLEIAASDPSTMMARFPLDFQLFWIGEFDDVVAALFGRTPEFVCTVSEVLPKAEKSVFEQVEE